MALAWAATALDADSIPWGTTAGANALALVTALLMIHFQLVGLKVAVHFEKRDISHARRAERGKVKPRLR